MHSSILIKYAVQKEKYTCKLFIGPFSCDFSMGFKVITYFVSVYYGFTMKYNVR